MSQRQKDGKVLTWKMQNRASLRGMSCLQCQLGFRRQLLPDSAPEELAPPKVIVSKQWMACTRILKKELLYYQFTGLLLIRYCNTAPGSGKYLIRRSFAPGMRLQECRLALYCLHFPTALAGILFFQLSKCRWLPYCVFVSSFAYALQDSVYCSHTSCNCINLFPPHLYW